MKALAGKYTVKASNTKGLLDSFVQLLISTRLYIYEGYNQSEIDLLFHTIVNT